ncbi:helix-turn-helix domain-containing protein [Glaciecola sp. MH2013]|uniref:helix-turn-helix domain-containing protein n=1 Tax=Glaciecola sp. MH2013 TaxID=2785524 RepID=UPI00189E995E|nr:helix-turn-helix domain-containing protein [Glaciecola sp. MH2013]MBF7073404.1 helix-turn-helix domain-containing protein [Glaciecola sp. MH2013]
MGPSLHNSKSSSANAPKKVSLLAYPNLCVFEFACALEVFAQPKIDFDLAHYEVSVCNQYDGKTHELTLGSLSNVKQVGLDELAAADLVILPGWSGAQVKPSKVLKEALTSVIEQGKTVASICSGAFLLGYCGILDGRKATTHWRYIDEARRLFPTANFDRDTLFCDDGQILTSAGSAAGLDLCLYIVAQHFGQHVANAYARQLVFAPYREGGQAQFVPPSAAPATSSPRDRFSTLLSTIERDLQQSYTVKKMADLVSMSERHFMRTFKSLLGTTPTKYLAQLRIQRARELLETTSLPIKTIANECGMGSEESLRHHFRLLLKTSPTQYRETFSDRL